ncbi:MAG: KilA-N domain-containing protein [Dechloromonas sp.]|nr:KilA-N domain-containing protein [Dechloromonas sp.]
MTKAAKHYGKKPVEFLRLPGTEEYLWAIGSYLKVEYSHLVNTKRGGARGTAGTWCHPKLAVFFARWLDVRFAVWCDLMIGFARSYCVATTSSRATSRHL